MAQVSVQDVAEIRRFSRGVQSFQDQYEHQLFLVESSVEDDIATARAMLAKLKERVEEAERYLRALENRRSSNPDSQLEEDIRQAEERLRRAKRNYEDGEEEKRRACIALERASSEAMAGRGKIRDSVNDACSAIDRAAQNIESYKY